MQFLRTIAAEYRVFQSHPRRMRALLAADSIYAFVLPVIEIFVAAYVMHSSHDVSRVVLYQLAIYVAVPVAFVLNGLLLGLVGAAFLYAAGMISSGCAILILMTSRVENSVDLLKSGLLLGLSTGVFWANRGLLALSVTKDDNRNYFYGVEMCIGTLSAVLVPLAVGLIVTRQKMGAEGPPSYVAVAVVSLLLTLLAAVTLLSAKFERPAKARFIYFDVHTVWRKMLGLALLRGLMQGYVVTLPAILVLSFVGNEDKLGLVEACGSAVVAVCVYILGRASNPQHRMRVFAMALWLFFAASLANAFLASALGAVIVVCGMLLAKPFQELAYYPIQFFITDSVAGREERSRYSYVVSHECATFCGRLFGCVLFLLFARCTSARAALLYALPIVAGLQLFSIPIARSVLGGAACLAIDAS